MGIPSGEKNVSKYSTKVWIFVRFVVVQTREKEDWKFSWRGCASGMYMSYMGKETRAR